MRKFNVFLFMLWLLITAGCSALSEIRAAEFVAKSYRLLCPGNGNVVILASLPYKGGMLVLAQKRYGGEAATIELFYLERGGVLQVATGVAAGEGKLSVHQLQDGKQTVVFGQLRPDHQAEPGNDGDGPAPGYTKAVLTLKNWQTEEKDFHSREGFIFAVSAGVGKFAVYGPEGKLAELRGAQGGIRQSKFVLWDDIPKPVALKADQVTELRLERAGFAGSDVLLRLASVEDYEQLILAFNRHLPFFRRQAKIDNLPRTEAVVFLQDGSKVTIRETGGHIFAVIYQRGTESNIFTFRSEELTGVFRGLKKRMDYKVYNFLH